LLSRVKVAVTASDARPSKDTVPRTVTEVSWAPSGCFTAWLMTSGWPWKYSVSRLPRPAPGSVSSVSVSWPEVTVRCWSSSAIFMLLLALVTAGPAWRSGCRPSRTMLSAGQRASAGELPRV